MENNLKSPKLVAVDMDGTFVHNDNSYDRCRFEKILKRMNDKGAKFVVASGNQYYELRDLFPGIDEQLAFVAENGAFVKDEDTMVFAADMDRRAVERVLDLHEEHPEINLILCGYESAYCQRGTVTQEYFDFVHIYYHHLMWVDNLREVKDQILKFALMVPEEQTEEYCELFNRELKGLVEPTASGHGCIDLIIPGCHKASGLKRLVERWNLDPKDCAAFGDGENDIEMLKYCHQSYAMANAPQTVKENAKHVCPSNEQDGVLVVLDELFPE